MINWTFFATPTFFLIFVILIYNPLLQNVFGGFPSHNVGNQKGRG